MGRLTAQRASSRPPCRFLGPQLCLPQHLHAQGDSAPAPLLTGPRPLQAQLVEAPSLLSAARKCEAGEVISQLGSKGLMAELLYKQRVIS